MDDAEGFYLNTPGRSLEVDFSPFFKIYINAHTRFNNSSLVQNFYAQIKVTKTAKIVGTISNSSSIGAITIDDFGNNLIGGGGEADNYSAYDAKTFVDDNGDVYWLQRNARDSDNQFDIFKMSSDGTIESANLINYSNTRNGEIGNYTYSLSGTSGLSSIEFNNNSSSAASDSSNNWSSHVDEAVSGNSMGKGDYYYDSTNKTYYVYTAAGLAYAVPNASSTSTIKIMNNIDLSDYNWDLGGLNETNPVVVVVVPSGSGDMYVSRDGNYYTGTVTIGGYTYTLNDGGRGCFISSKFGFSNEYFSVTAGGSVDITLTFPHDITGSLKGTIGSDGTGTLTLTINGGSYTEERGYTLEKNDYEIYGYKA